MVRGAESPENVAGGNEVFDLIQSVSDTETPLEMGIELRKAIGSVPDTEPKKEFDEGNEGLGAPNHNLPAEDTALVMGIQSEKEVEEQNDGSKTPSRKITTPTECPPAPRKFRLKPKVSDRKSCRRSLRFESERLEMEPTPGPAYGEEPKRKRARRDDAVF